ncbi:MobC family replication-relaxation protein [Sulfurisoma sediminicola]|uniref:Uncharacterized protein n=1 Tax=Sulfurisoma sediminicola TaxID=1381557 RepID=A0A497XCY9_9PROT|nr:MobC family replication-relaxation protein [Sulfurisoma sediminicola]RLJ64594.1 hypothetical protein DFR35_1235 [Sulfurisoma sediminicola]
MALIHDKQEREQRQAAKRRALLRWLRVEIFTRPGIAGDVMGITSARAVRKTVAAMARDGLVVTYTLALGSGVKLALIGITAHGQGMAFDPAIDDGPESKYFEPSRVPVSVLAHALDLQRLRLAAERAGWHGWRYGDREAKWQKGQSRPDAIVTTAAGEIVGVECERTIKTLKRYEVVIADRLQAIKAGKFTRVLYTSPTPEIAAAVAAMFAKVEAVPVAGQRVKLEQRHRDAFRFTDYPSFVVAA